MKKELVQLTPETKAEIRETLNLHDRYDGCYFWTPRGNAASRRREEFSRSFEFTSPKGDKIEVSQSLSISCRNFYYSLTVTRNGNRSNVKLLRGMV